MSALGVSREVRLKVVFLSRSVCLSDSSTGCCAPRRAREGAHVLEGLCARLRERGAEGVAAPVELFTPER